ncbi:hypothetical protein C1H46_001784 [Malus baccata]|uniref:Uncharacterized protein n=1 Tax=Malus baccata TaxID=106549 RepID=A0A540NNG4_MALBA|nr:hypothetical protein C1H46_001784 [Malus baccata]
MKAGRKSFTNDEVDAKIVVAGISTTCSQKIHNQLKLAAKSNAKVTESTLPTKVKEKMLLVIRIIGESIKKAAVVDPIESDKVLKAAQEHGVGMKLILTTRHHWSI